MSAAMMGLGDCSMRCARSLRVGIPPGVEVVTLPPLLLLLSSLSSLSSLDANSLISAPALKEPNPSGRPTRIMAEMAGSAREAWRDVWRYWRTWEERALTGLGLLPEPLEMAIMAMFDGGGVDDVDVVMVLDDTLWYHAKSTSETLVEVFHTYTNYY